VVDGKVQIIPEVKAALDAFSAAGLMAAGQDYERGGMQLPAVVDKALAAWFTAANVGTAAYTFLTMSNANTLLKTGTPEQIERFVNPMLEGRFFGTMCLSEPQAGSSLSDITTARCRTASQYRITGNKMWISAGEHELAENIIHLVLAKIPGEDGKLIPGVKGISLFIVPKYLVNDDGSLGARNDVALAGLNHKMGNRGTTNCLLNFGENGGAIGYLVGKPHHGLANMFHMMNEARIGVGLGAAVLGYTGYLHALDYARNRPQGRHPAQKDPAQPQLPSSNTPTCGACCWRRRPMWKARWGWCCTAPAWSTSKTPPKRRKRASMRRGCWNSSRRSPSRGHRNGAWKPIAGHPGARRLWLHARVQRRAVLPRQSPERHPRRHARHPRPRSAGPQGFAARWRLVQGIWREIRKTVRKVRGSVGAPDVAPVGYADIGQELLAHADALEQAWQALEQTTQKLYAVGDMNKTLANASTYLEACGHIVVAWIWLQQALLAAASLQKAMRISIAASCKPAATSSVGSCRKSARSWNCWPASTPPRSICRMRGFNRRSRVGGNP
jgi:butyryl-CoA dehydrogenase